MKRYDPRVSSGSYRWYVVGILAVVYAVNVMDRALVNILQEEIKRDLHLTDSQLGMLTGLSFAVFYATLAVPIARFADRSNRVFVLCVCLVLWSLMTAGCGIATGFVTLLLFRMGVGVGEAGGYPPSAAALSDYFSKDRRATALAIFGLGAPIGSTFGLFAAGMLHDLVGWRGAFVVAGLIGLLLAPLVLFTVREPQRGVSDEGEETVAGAPAPSLLQVATVLWRLKAIRYLYLANMFHGFALYAHGSWMPPFYARTFGMHTSQIAFWLGLLSIFGAVGTFAGGVLADRLGKRDPRWRIWILALASMIMTPLAIAQFLAPSWELSLVFAIGPALLLTFFVAPTIALGQTLVLPHMRATTAAIMLMMYNIFGLGLGPLFVGVLSDYLTHTLGLGPNALRYAVIAGLLVEVVTVVFYFLSARALPKDLARDRSQDFAPAARDARVIPARAM